MLDANAEIARLRQRLRYKNLSDSAIDSICDEAASEISNTTSDILADAMNEAVNAGGDVQSIDFIDQIRAVRMGPTFQVTTDSGKTDFSTAPFPMLPSLLKNAKVAKDGSLYKVIPIKQKSGSGNNQQVGKTTEAAMQDINNARKAAKVSTGTDTRSVTSPDSMKGMDTVAAMQQMNKFRSSQVKEKSKEPTINFRTASSKQDPNTQWVNPGRKVDLSGALNDINANLQDNIDKAIDEIIRRIEDLYW
jgi:hypothetical protein